MDRAHSVGEPVKRGRLRMIRMESRRNALDRRVHTQRPQRWRALGILMAALLAVMSASVAAQDLKFVRIGTGGTGGTYFPVGGLIASVISNPPGSRACEVGGSCGVPGLIATAVSTQGSVENVRSIAAGQLDLALCQADVAYYAYFGTMGFADDGPIQDLRAIANLYPEAVHLVARPDAGISSVSDLRGKRVSVGEQASGTLVAAKTILQGYGIKEEDLVVVYEKLGKASDMLLADEIDAFFMVGGYPLGAIAHAAETGKIDIVSITGEEAKQIIADHPFFVSDIIPDGTYNGVPEVRTLSVGAQLVTGASLNEELVYGIARALWHPNNRPVLDGGHPNGKRIQPDTALDGVAIPLHPGAARFYRETGVSPRGSVF